MKGERRLEPNSDTFDPITRPDRSDKFTRVDTAELCYRVPLPSTTQLLITTQSQPYLQNNL